ncbi:MAG: PilZ domain-containing protein [Deltaproteobacteria bacterium]|nr:PilZ domain-containing protein [Deltaproteobacteria bacterium]
MKKGLAEIQKVRPTTVHKDFEDDVLIYNERGVLPSFIALYSLDQAALDSTDKLLLEQYYRPVQCSDKNIESDKLFLRCIPQSLTRNDIGSITGEDTLSDLIGKHFANDAEQWVLRSEFVCEMDQILLAKRFLHRSLQINDYERHILFKVIEKLPGLSSPEVIYVNMHIDTKHYFFYRKHHEHVPGLMILEGVRQAMYAQYYRYSKYTREQISLTIENINVDFRNFINANYPVRIRVEDVLIAAEHSSTDVVEKIATFFQSDKVVAVATMRTKVIKMKLFKRLRRVKPDANNRFIPIKNIAKSAAFMLGDGTKIEGTMNDMSMYGIGATFDTDLNFSQGDSMDFIMFVEGIGFINGKSEVRWSKNGEGSKRVGFKILEITNLESVKLQEAIKNFTFLNISRAKL